MVSDIRTTEIVMVFRIIKINGSVSLISPGPMKLHNSKLIKNVYTSCKDYHMCCVD